MRLCYALAEVGRLQRLIRALAVGTATEKPAIIDGLQVAVRAHELPRDAVALDGTKRRIRLNVLWHIRDVRRLRVRQSGGWPAEENGSTLLVVQILGGWEHACDLLVGGLVLEE